MKKSCCYILLPILTILSFAQLNAFAETFFSQPATARQLIQQVKYNEDQHQITLFFKQLAQQNPAQFATFLLGSKMIYVHNPNVIYIGIAGEDEVFVVCKVEDSDVGNFYHAIHKKGGRYFTNEFAAAPSTQNFITLFEIK